MKPLRLLLIAAVVLLVLLGAGVAVGLTPSVQRWAVLRVASQQPGLKLEVASVRVGLGGIHVSGLKATKGGLTAQVDQLDAAYSPWALLFRRHLILTQVRGQGLVLDVSRWSAEKTGAAAAGGPAAAPGVLAQQQLPVAITLADCLLQGRGLLPGPKAGVVIPVDFTLAGGQFAPGGQGELVLKAALKNPAAEALVTALHTEVRLQARQSDHRTFDRVGLTAIVKAEGAKLAGPQQLEFAAELTRVAAGEQYSLSVDTILAGKAANLVGVQALLPAGGNEYRGDWRLAARTVQIEPFFLGAALPDFDVHGDGRFTFDAAKAAGSLQGAIEAQLRRLEAIEPAWRALGTVKAVAKFDVAESDGIARLKQLTLDVSGDQPVFGLTAARAAEINFKARRLQLGDSEAGEALTLTLHGLPLAWVRPFVKGVDVSGGVVTGQLAITGEPDRLRLRAAQPLRVGGLTLVQAGLPLLTKADISVGFDALLNGEQLEATVSECTLTTAAGDRLAAQAKVTVPVVAEPAVSVVATYQADLPTLLAPWLPLGRLKATGDVDLTAAGPRLEIRRLQAGVTDAAGQDLFKATALRSFAFNLGTRQAEVAGATGPVDLVRVALGHFPLSAIPLNRLGVKLDGAVSQGEFLVSVDGAKVVIRSPTPFKLGGVSLARGGRPALTGLAIEARPTIELNGPSTRLETGDVNIRTASGASLLVAKGDVTQGAQGLRGAMTFSVEVPSLASQPAWAGAQAVTAGRVSGEVRAALGSVNQLEARVTVNGLVAAEGGTLPIANLSLRAVAQPNGRVLLQAPLLLDRSGERSDLNFALELAPAGRGVSVNGALRSDHVELADALAILGVFVGHAEAPATTPATAPAAAAQSAVVADTTAMWSRLSGRVNLELKSVVRGTDWSMQGLTGVLVIEPADVTLQKLEAAFGDKGRLSAKALLSFTKGPRPYELTGDFSLTEFDAGKLFKALDPAKPAMLEGIFAVAGKFAGDGETLERTLERTRGAFELTSRAGVFRGLQRTTGKVSMTSKAVELGASVLGSIFGSEKVTKTAEKVAGQAYFVDQLAQSIGELNYDQLSVKLTRDDALNVALEDFSLVSPEIRLIGKGAVTHVAGKPLLEQPMAASLSIAGRGKLEELLGKLRLLNGAKDELGYARTREAVTLGGTLARPDPTAFFTRIATAKIGDLLAPEN